MAWWAAAASLAGGLLANSSAKNAAKGMQYRPWSTALPGLGSAQFSGGYLNLNPDYQTANLNNALNQSYMDQLGLFNNYQQNALGQDYLRGATTATDEQSTANLYSLLNSGSLPNSFFGNQGTFQQQALGAQALGNEALLSGITGYGGQNFLGAGQNMLGQGYQNQDFNSLRNNLLSNFDPNQAASQYTNLLRQQAQPLEEQATAKALNGLFASGRLGTTGGATQLGQLSQAQQQADISRQIAGQQYGLQQQLMAQQGLDAALNAEQGRQIAGFGANQQGMLNQYGLAQGLASTGAGLFGSSLQNAGTGLGIAQGADQFGFNRLMGLNQTGFDRANTLYTASENATQDRFNRAMQLFGAENALAQQYMSNFTGLLGAQQSNNQQLMDLARIGASVGQSQTAANANAAMMRNQGNQDMIAGFLGAIDAWNKKDG